MTLLLVAVSRQKKGRARVSKWFYVINLTIDNQKKPMVALALSSAVKKDFAIVKC